MERTHSREARAEAIDIEFIVLIMVVDKKGIQSGKKKGGNTI